MHISPCSEAFFTRLLITGSSGLLGSKIIAVAQNRFGVIPTYSTQTFSKNSPKMDITNKEEVFEVIRKFKPDVVIHTAAETNVDLCEVDKDKAWRTNAEGTHNVAIACKHENVKLVYASSDYVFFGDKGNYMEEDKPNPINYYGLAKLKGEEFVKECCGNYIIVRPSAIYGFHKRRLYFVTWIIDSLKSGKSVNVVTDHYDSPTLADNLADMILEIVEMGAQGIYHVCGSERIDRYSFALKIADTFDLDGSMINPVKMKGMKWIAKRPYDSSLLVDKVKKLGLTPLNVEEGLNKMKESLSH